MTPDERALALRLLEENRARLLAVAAGMSADQADFRPSPADWSVAECVAHIVLVENRILARIEAALNRPPEPEKRPAGEDQAPRLMRLVPNRGRRVNAPEAVVPTRDWLDLAELIQRFETARARTAGFAAGAGPGLRERFFPHFVFGELDCYEWLLFLPLHSERHIRQMEEAMADPGFPGAGLVKKPRAESGI
jgi:hypothetical protein